MRQRRITYNEKRTTSVLGGVRRRIASVSVHTQNIPENTWRLMLSLFCANKQSRKAEEAGVMLAGCSRIKVTGMIRNGDFAGFGWVNIRIM